MTITLLTPTGDRPSAFSLCEWWMGRQTYRWPWQWLVVDDGHDPTVTTMGQQIVRRQPQTGEPAHTLPLNLLAALPYITGDVVLVIEDDDVYLPQYVQTMADRLTSDEMVGEGCAIYYHPSTARWLRHENMAHASLAATGWRRSADEIVRSSASQTKTPCVDLAIWRDFLGTKRVYPPVPLIVQLKGMPGRTSWLSAHVDHPQYQADAGHAMLRKLVGHEAAEAVLAAVRHER